MTDAGGDANAGSIDPREELAELVAATRALVEQYEGAGAFGLPTEAPAQSLLDQLGAQGALGASGAQGAAQPRPARPAPPPAFAGDFATPGPRAAPPPAPAPRPPAIAPASPIAPAAPIASAAAPAPLPAAPPPARPAPPPPAAPAATACAAAPAPAGAIDERKTRLTLLAEQARTCTACVLHTRRKQAVFARGNPFAELCFIGEGPGADEDAQGEPFVGKAGQLLDKMIAAMGYRPSEVYICNIVKCRPPENRKPEPEEMAACMPFVTQQIALVKPKVIVALGATAVQGLLGTTVGIMRLRGKWKLYKGSIPIMPTFHPAYLLRQPEAKREAWADLQEVMRHLGRSPPPRG
ncbi:MAG: uracil-DNA glycosylase [Byssovorax sp.]